MEGMNGTFWIGLALAIPLAIIGNLLTPWVQSWVARRSEAAAAKRERITAAQRARIEHYVAQPERLYIYLLSVLLATTLLTSLCGILAGAFFIAGTFEQNNSLFYGGGQAIVIAGGVGVATLCVDAMRVISRVRSSGG